MREIKFRVWDETNHEMIIIDNVFSGIDMGFHVRSNTLIDELPIMQYTGLKDKNGKEIYEGDIVKIKKYGETIQEVVDIEPTKYGLESSPFIWRNSEMFGYNTNPQYSEVIGNIYENPELIKPTE